MYSCELCASSTNNNEHYLYNREHVITLGPLSGALVNRFGHRLAQWSED